MTEAILHLSDQQPLIPRRYDCDIFRNPQAPNRTPLEIVMAFDPVATVKEDPVQFRDRLGDAYTYEKSHGTAPALAEQPDAWPGVDLLTQRGVDAMMSHTIAHAVTGNLDTGASNTTSIPYWDREAAIVGAYYMNSNQEDFERSVQLMDALSINILRAHCEDLSQAMHSQLSDSNRLTFGIQRGQLSKQSGLEQQKHLRDQHEELLDYYTEVYLAKLKHLLWLTDAQADPVMRGVLLPEVSRHVERVRAWGMPDEVLTIDMGADTGISSAGQRPPYEITVYKQLTHAGKMVDVKVTRNYETRVERQRVYELPQEVCDRLPVDQVLQSIARPGNQLPAYEANGKYHLPWKFEDRPIQLPA